MEPSVKYDGLVEGLNLMVSKLCCYQALGSLSARFALVRTYIYSPYYSPLVESDSDSVANLWHIRQIWHCRCMHTCINVSHRAFA